jgi:predicted metal-dependent hydrolase
MSTVSGWITVNDIDVEVVYKDIKNLHIGVYPPNGRVRVAAPARLDTDRVRLAVSQRLTWIRQQRALLGAVERQTEREMVMGESHYAWGVRYRLKVVEGDRRPHVQLDGRRLLLYVPAGIGADDRLALLQRWYRAELQDRVPELIQKWEPLIGQEVRRWTVRRMKTKWGSCNREAGHISLNLELAKRHPRCLEYVIVHEMVHLLERNHSDRFARLLDRFLPDWRTRRDQLSETPLVHERWAAAKDAG